MTFGKYNCSCLMIIVLLLLSFPLKAKNLEFNTQLFPPYSYLKNGDLAGPVAETVKAACELLNWQCTFRLHKYWADANSLVKQGQSDALFVVDKNQQRKRWLRFSQPLMMAEYGFFSLASKDIGAKSKYDLSGLKVGVYSPSNTAYQLTNMSRNLVANGLKGIDIKWSDSTEDAMVKLLRGQVDLVYSNKLVGENWSQKATVEEKIIYNSKQKNIQYFIGFNKNRISNHVIKEFNKALRQLDRRGITAKIFDKYNMPYIKLASVNF